MSKEFKSSLVVCVAKLNPSLDTGSVFDAAYKEGKRSSIDEFLLRLRTINQLAPTPSNYDIVQAQLVLLGVVAAVESYLRSILRKVISIDSYAQEQVHKKDVSYGAALHLSRDLLPEAILERISFVSRDSIVGAIKDLVGVKGQVPSDLDVAIADYVRICQLRHCAVHRFGKLGANNAIALGLNDHSRLLEKPLSIDYASLQSAIAISSNFVKTVNNTLFNAVISRYDWSWDYKNDRPDFIKYYQIFADKVSSPKTASPKKLYTVLEKQYNSFARRG